MPPHDEGALTAVREPDAGEDGRGLIAGLPFIARLPFARTPAARWILVLIPWMLAAAWVAYSLHNRFHEMPWGTNWEDAYVYQRAADNFIQHPSGLYDRAAIQVSSNHATAAFIYPPSGLLPFLALSPIATDAAGQTTHAGEAMAGSIWTVVDLCCVFLALTLFGRRVGLSWGRLGIAMLLLAFTAPVLVEINSGQVNGLELLLLVLAWERMPRASGGVLLGLALALKPVAALFLIALVLRRRWRALGAAVATLAVVTLPFAILIGFDGIRYYVTDVGPFMLRQDTWDAANLSLTSLTQNFLGGRGLDYRDPRMVVPFASAGLALAVLVAVRVGLAAGVGLALVRERLQGNLELAVLLATIPLTAGTVWFHYYLFAIPLVFVAMTSTSTVVRRAAWILTLPVLFNGLFVRWVIDPFQETDVLSRIVYAKAHLLPLLTLALVGVFLMRALRSQRGPALASASAGCPTTSAPEPDLIAVTGRASEPVAHR